MLVIDFLLYMILSVLAVFCLECTVLVGLRVWGELYAKYFKK